MCKMKVIILAAGTGRRLRPLTEDIPKCLININGRTILENIIKNCTDSGINDFIIVVGHKKELVIEKLSDIKSKYKEYGKDIDYCIVENRLYDITNSGVSLDIAFAQIDRLSDIIIINGDLIFDKRILHKLLSKDTTTIVIDDKKILTKESFKVTIEDNHIKFMGKDIPINESTGEFIGLSIIKPTDLKIFKDILKNLIVKNERQYYSCIFKKFSDTRYVNFIFVNDLKWTDVDVPEDLQYAGDIIDEIYI